MIWYWLILAIRGFVWLFKLPKSEDLAYADENERCPNCGHRDGSLRCVLQAKPGPLPSGPRAIDRRLIDAQILCQHNCHVCGARWHVKPIRKITPSDVLPSVARNRLERAQDRQAYLHEVAAPETANR